MNALITGGAGYIGGTVAHLLAAAGHRVVVYDNLSHSQRLSVPASSAFIEGEVGDRTTMEAALRSHKLMLSCILPP